MNEIRGTTVNAKKIVAGDGTKPGSHSDFARRILIAGAADKTLETIEKLAVQQAATPAIIQTAAVNNGKPVPPDAKEKALNGQLLALALGAREFQLK